MSDHVTVNVEEQIALSLYERGEGAAARQAILQADSLANDLPFDQLERQRAVPVTEDEAAERKKEQKAAATARLRADRNGLLAASDWTQLPDVPATTRGKWAAYRQQLRDLPAKTKNPSNVKWPEVPDA